MNTQTLDLSPRWATVQRKDAPDWSLLPGDGNEDPERMRAEAALFGGALSENAIRIPQSTRDVGQYRLRDVQAARIRGRRTGAARFRAALWIALIVACTYAWYRFVRA